MLVDPVIEVKSKIYDAIRTIQYEGLFNTPEQRQRTVTALNGLEDEILGEKDIHGNIIRRPATLTFNNEEVLRLRQKLGRTIAWDVLETDPAIREYVNNGKKGLYDHLNNLMENMVNRGLGQAAFQAAGKRRVDRYARE